MKKTIQKLREMHYRSRTDREPDEIIEYELRDYKHECLWDTIDWDSIRVPTGLAAVWDRLVGLYWYWRGEDIFICRWLRRCVSYPRNRYRHLRRRWRLATGKEKLIGVKVIPAQEEETESTCEDCGETFTYMRTRNAVTIITPYCPTCHPRHNRIR